MNDFLIRKYTDVKESFTLLTKIKYYAFIRFCLRFLANTILPIWFMISRKTSKKQTLLSSEKDESVIVSLTTFPARISRIWIVIECMLRQTVKPNRIILWLSKDQFPSEEFLPKRLLNLKESGLEIILCDDDLRSHKKYYYSLQNFPEDLIITIDDDLLYPSFLIEDLLKLHEKFPETIVCCRGLKINDSDEVIKYNNLDYLYNGDGPNNNVFFTTGGGTLFTKNNFVGEVLNKNVFMENCKYADDVWLNLMAQFNNTEVVKSNNHFESIPIYNFRDIKLSSVNVDNGLNDKQLHDVIEYYNGTYTIKNRKKFIILNFSKL